MKRIAVLVLSTIMLVSLNVSPPAKASDSSSYKNTDLASAIAEAKKENPLEFREKTELLKSNNALMALFVGAPSEDVLDFYVDFFALYSSLSQVKSFMEKTEGKHFVVSGTPESPNVELLDGPPIGTYGSCCACWRAWVASAAYMVASGMICGAVGAAGAIVTGGVGAISGFMCGGVFWAIEKLPNFDDACK